MGKSLNAGPAYHASQRSSGLRVRLRTPYGVALQQEGYPLIRRWSCGDWSPECQVEMAQFISAVATQRSAPMLAVLAIAIDTYPHSPGPSVGAFALVHQEYEARSWGWGGWLGRGARRGPTPLQDNTPRNISTLDPVQIHTRSFLYPNYILSRSISDLFLASRSNQYPF